jgi:uncharacterized membrane-anchored protein YhcB (DUF1043 family)
MELIALAPMMVGVVGIIIGIAMTVREERQKERKMAELEAALAEAKEKLKQ